MLIAALAVAAVAAGVTGAWSPCGFSMVDTLAAAARESGRRVLPPALTAFTVGALAGGVVTFGGLALAGSLLRLGGDGLAAGAAAVLAGAAALAELASVRIRPQVRRQVPEPWRRTMPLALAAGLYGVLLGVGFATFVLTLAVAALAGVCLLSGDPTLGLVVGLGFGAGRALPVVLLAPVAEAPVGLRALELMGERPAALRGLRVADGLALGLCALAIGTGSAWASTRVASDASDPTVAGGLLAWDRPGQGGMVVGPAGRIGLPGTDPALGGPYLAWHAGDQVTIVRTDVGGQATRTIPGVDELAVSLRWLAWRRPRPGGGSVIEAASLQPGAPARRIATGRPGVQVGRPGLDGDRLVFHVAGRGGSAIREVDLRTRRRRTLVRSRSSQLLNPSLAGGALLFVRVSKCGQQLELRRRGRERALLRARPLAGTDAGHERGHTEQGSGTGACPHRRRTPKMLWTTALSRRFAYVSLLRPAAGGAQSRLVRVSR